MSSLTYCVSLSQSRIGDFWNVGAETELQCTVDVKNKQTRHAAPCNAGAYKRCRLFDDR